MMKLMGQAVLFMEVERVDKDERLDAAAKVVVLMEALTRGKGRLTVRDLEAQTAVPRSSVGRILLSLSSAGWVVRDANDRFCPSLRFLLLGRSGNISDVLAQRVAGPMRELALATGKTALLSLLDGDRGLCVHTEEPEMAVKFVAHPGMTVPLHAGATGKILLSWAPESVREKVFRASPVRPDGRQASESELRGDVETIRRQGWAFSQEEWIAHAADLSVPVFDQSGEFVAQLGLAGLAGTFSDRFDELLQKLLATSRVISQNL